MRALLARFLRASEGSIAVMSAASGVCVVGCLALAVDIGSLHLERRKLQNVADLAAVAAVSSRQDPAGAASAVLAANGINASIQVETGTFTADPSLAPDARYSPGGAAPNAVRVMLSRPGTLYFARVIYGGDPPQIRVRATAAEQNVAQISIGSRLASLDEGVLNDLLGDLLGSSISLSLMDYNGLAAADLDLVSFLNALAAEASVTTGTYEELLSATMNLGDVLDAAAHVANASGASAAEIALNKLELAPGGVYALPLDGRGLIGLGEIGKLSLGERPSGFAANVSALDLVRAAVNTAGPNNQAQIGFGAGVPGIAALTLSVVIGEPPQGTSWITLGPEGVEVHTAQTRVRAAATVGPVSVLGSNVSLQLPLALDIAAGRARLTEIDCGTNPAADAEVTLAVRPAIGGLHIGQPASAANWNSFAAPAMTAAQVVTVLNLVTVSAEASALVSNTQDIPVTFDADDIAARTIKTVDTSAPLSTLIASAFGNLNVSVQLIGIGLPGVTTAAANAVRAALQPVGAALEPVLDSLLDALGIGLGEADVRVHGVRCGAPALVM